MSVQIMTLDPADVNVERHSSDNVVKTVFEDYFTERNEKILSLIKDVNPIYVKAKGHLMQRSSDKELSQSNTGLVLVSAITTKKTHKI
jgi:hypothetical protein